MATIKERAGINFKSLPPSELVSEPPVFNLDRAGESTTLVTLGGFAHYHALSLALILAIYNQDPTNNVDYERATEVIGRFPNMVSSEVAAAKDENPLPTIGFEVESPKKPFDRVNDSEKYAKFFDTITMPRNKVNGRVDQPTGSDFWEFSPPPSYSAIVQRRILHELIRGRFIPSLRYSQHPDDVKTYLDEKLVSLHINLGIPKKVARELPNIQNDPDVLLFSSMFAYAFTSPLRLKHRAQQVYTDIKDADETTKSGGKNKRLELKAFEVRTEAVYRLMEEVQLLSAGLFAEVGDYREDLAEKWKEAAEDVRVLYKRYTVEPEFIRLRERASELAGNSEFVQLLRKTITYYALNIRNLISLP